MKSIKSVIIIGCLSLTGLTSCFFEEKNIFDQSSAQRMNMALAEHFDLLTSSPSGWVFNYFPTDDQIGYTLLLNFDKNGSVRVAAKNRFTNNRYRDAVSLFRMIGDNGPVLTFDSFNPLLHFFSNPEDIPSTEEYEQGRGLGGDYEFIVMKTSPDKIILKGKKRGVYMNLNRLPENQDWVDYFTRLDDMNNYLFNKNIPQILLSINNSFYTLDNGISHIFVAVPEGGDPISENEKIPFIVTDKGILFSKTVNLNNVGIREFHLSEDKNELVCVDEGVDAKIIALDPVDFFLSFLNNRKNMTFVNSNDNMCEFVKNTYTVINDGVVARSRRLDYIQFTNHRDQGVSLAIRTSRTGGTNIEGLFSFTITKKNGIELDLAFNGFTENYDRNGKTYYDTYEGVANFVEAMTGTYKLLIQGNALSSNRIRFTDTSDPNKWFDLVTI